VPLFGLGELRLAEGTSLQEVEHEDVDLGTNRLHDVEGERLAPSGVTVHEAESRVEADHMTGQDGLGLQ